MLRTKLLDTSTFRLTIGYVSLFALSAVVALYVVYAASSSFIEQQMRDAIDFDLQGLLEEYVRTGRDIDSFGAFIDDRVDPEREDRKVILLIFSGTGKTRTVRYGTSLDPLPTFHKVGDDFVRFDMPVPIPSGRDGDEASRNRPTEVHPALGRVAPLDADDYLLVARDMNDRVATVREIKVALSLGVLVFISLGLVGGYFVSRWMLHRLDVVNRTTARIMAGDLSRRIEVSDTDDEFDELGRNVNSMLDRIDGLLASMRQVTDDIAHDLRTPLTRLRSRIEVGLMHELDHAEARELLEATIRDADNLIETFNALLSIARAEAGGQRGEWEPIDLSELTHEVFELYEPLAEDKGAKLTLQTGTGVTTLGNRQLVAQAIANLADNAVKYAPEGGHVWLRTTAYPAPRIEVADDGPGIPEDQRERAKQRFVRLDATRTTPGSGLGLSLVDAVAKLHDARLELLDNQPGLKVWLTFHPLPPPDRTTRTPGERAPAYASGPAGGDRGSA